MRTVTETYAYASNDEIGMVFIPGAAFSQSKVSKLDSYLAVGDSLVVSVRPQAPRSGCNWIAKLASKISCLNEPPQIERLQRGNCLLDTSKPSTANDIRRGTFWLRL